MELHQMPAYEVAGLLKTGKMGVREYTQAHLTRIETLQPKLNCFVSTVPESALARADAVQTLIENGSDAPLSGIPMALKDNICTQGLRTTCASRMLENFAPPYDATVTEKLEAAGSVLLGKLNMDEFAMGSSNENSYFGPVRNPWDTERVPGGSSGGAAAAVAAGMVPFAIGSDTGGSIRQPASFCGVVGMKPTYGAISRFGLVAFASSLDQMGPLTNNVRDCAWVLDSLMGHDPRDATSAPVQHASCLSGLDDGVHGMSIGLAREYFGKGLHPEVEQAVMKAVQALENAGAMADACSVPSTAFGISAYYLLSSAEASANLARYDGIRYGYRSEAARDMKELYRLSRGEGFGREVKQRILLGTHALSSGYHDALYVKALKVRRMIHEDFQKAFQTHDFLIAPVAPTTAFKLGEKTTDPLTMYLGDVYTVAVNLAGLPALVVPCGLDSMGLPIGVQLIGKPFSEALLLRAGQAIENELGRFSSPVMKQHFSIKEAGEVMA